MRLLLDERILANGQHVATYASRDGERIALHDEPGELLGALSALAIDRVMLRYAKPLETAPQLDGDRLDLGEGRALTRWRFHAVVDTEARDYLVYVRPDEEPIAVIATMATAALRYLALNIRSSDS